MKYYQYSPSQLEAQAAALIEEHDRERLTKARHIDVYDVVDLIGCTPDWLYLTPDLSILGMTAFHDVSIWSWPCGYYKSGMMPERVFIEKGTIVIDRALQESGNIGRENFTVIHECFHQLLHPKCFQNKGADYTKICTQKSFKNHADRVSHMTAIDIIEYQANFCAAAFLMPKNAVIQMFAEILGLNTATELLLPMDYKVNHAIREMADQFEVSYTAMKYRLQTLKMLAREPEKEEYII